MTSSWVTRACTTIDHSCFWSVFDACIVSKVPKSLYRTSWLNRVQIIRDCSKYSTEIPWYTVYINLQNTSFIQAMSVVPFDTLIVWVYIRYQWADMFIICCFFSCVWQLLFFSIIVLLTIFFNALMTKTASRLRQLLCPYCGVCYRAEATSRWRGWRAPSKAQGCPCSRINFKLEWLSLSKCFSGLT